MQQISRRKWRHCTPVFKGQKPDKYREIQHLNNVFRCVNHSISGIIDDRPFNY